MNNNMRNEMLNKTYAAMTSGYHEAVWNAMRGSELAYGEMDQAKISANGGTYLLPAKTASRFSAGRSSWPPPGRSCCSPPTPERKHSRRCVWKLKRTAQWAGSSTWT